MAELPPTETNGIEPIFVSVKQAAQALAISQWVCYQLLDSGKIEGRYEGRRRLVRVSSLHTYADNLPTERPESESA